MLEPQCSAQILESDVYILHFEVCRIMRYEMCGATGGWMLQARPLAVPLRSSVY